MTLVAMDSLRFECLVASRVIFVLWLGTSEIPDLILIAANAADGALEFWRDGSCLDFGLLFLAPNRRIEKHYINVIFKISNASHDR